MLPIENALPPTMKSADTQDSGAGFLMVGINEQGQVIINLDHDRTGHIIFSPFEAIRLASLLFKKAVEAELNRRWEGEETPP